ncbi:polysaccharide biosynthesis/export family protein [Chitinophaga horti]|uniref:Polysaccharide biosynthesis/export family protein n=1 Tax=Chitinophaga horti TaxID=2920382 RepID=A0ABY6J2D9_9BACT|nr:polysaccharide biosynthesis/export family protein [Chitinophaga horti]UYQ92364.1 polysaccharide biosynthesis/export family protein [Chitinophaga horti]
MRRTKESSLKTGITILLTLLIFSSCVSTKNAVYFNNLNDTALKTAYSDFQPVIQKNDILQINVNSANPEETIIYNVPNSSGASGIQAVGVTASTPAAGFLVDQQGFIQYPMLGQVKAEGLTKKQLTDYLKKELTDKKLLVDPVVSIRFVNYRVTLLGEVAKPTVVNVTNEKITILEALGMAGDITIYGKKENVLVIRETGGKQVVKRLNLNDASIFSSPYYYLQSNDIVYVEPNKSKVASADRSRQVLPIVMSGLSLLVIVIDRLL